jgi:hypothetical protein
MPSHFEFTNHNILQFVPMAVGMLGFGESGDCDRSLDEVYYFLGQPAAGAASVDMAHASMAALDPAASTGTAGCRFEVVVEEDQQAARVGKSGPLSFGGGDDRWRGSGDGLRASEGCSCLFGNPCVDQYVCRDWVHRIEVSTKNGFKG